MAGDLIMDFTLVSPEPEKGEVSQSPPKGTLDLRCCDCMELMKEFPDGHFDLAIVDPPYGIGWDRENKGMAETSSKKWKQPTVANRYAQKDWDKNPPTIEYFNELMRVSRKQIIWGGNYFFLPPSGGWVVWVKGTAEGMSLSDAELAWTNAANNVKLVERLWAGFRKCEEGQRIHPTQKPMALYQWLLETYAEPGQRILDTHLGSGSHAIACHYFGAHLTASEIDPDYFREASARIKRETAQQTLF